MTTEREHKNDEQRFNRNFSEANLIIQRFILIFLLVLAMAKQPEGAEAKVLPDHWIEDWGEGWEDRWFPIGFDCSTVSDNTLVQDCQSGAIQSKERFPVKQRIEYTGTVFGEPGETSTTESNLWHHVLIGVDDAGEIIDGKAYPGQYCGMYGSYNPEEGTDRIFSISRPTVELLGEFPHQEHTVSVVWEYEKSSWYGQVSEGVCEYWVDGDKLQEVFYRFTVPDLAVWKGASSVNPGMSDDGSSSHAEHGPAYVILGDIPE